MRDESHVGSGDRPAVSLDNVRRTVQRSRLAVGLLRLPQRRFLELSDPAKHLLGLDGLDLNDIDVLSCSREPDLTSRLFTMIAEGGLDGYRARRVLSTGRRAGAIVPNVYCRVVARSAAAARGPVSDDAPRCGSTPNSGEAVALVSYTDETQCAVSGATSSPPVAEAVLTSIVEMVHADDIGRVLEAFESAAGPDGDAVVSVRCGRRGAWQETRIRLVYLAEQDRFEFTLAPDADVAYAAADRASELERVLRHIAADLEAAGLLQSAARLPDIDRIPGVEALSSRQWEIVTRLLRGERVPRIARAMYLSPSTVRNHLSTIFRRLGVHSQAELIDHLSPPD